MCAHTHIVTQTGRNRLFHVYKNKLKKHENTSVSECISLSVLEKASPLRPCLSPPLIFLTSWSPQRSFLRPHAHPLPGCHHLLNLRCPSPEEPLCFYFFSLHKDKHSNGMTQQLQWQTTTKTNNLVTVWSIFMCFKHTIHLTPKASQLCCCQDTGSCLNINPLHLTLWTLSSSKNVL